MLLRRVIDHVKAQNWTAVTLDFLIVVVGVFIGIQVSNWNDARADRAAEKQSLELLFNEVQNNVAHSAMIINHAEQLQTDREAAAAKLRGAEPEKGDAARGMANMTMYRDMPTLQTAYDELTGSGDITLIRSDDIRRAMSIYNGVVVWHDRGRAEYINDAPDIMGLGSDYMKLTYDAAQSSGYSIEMDWAAAGEDRALMNAVNKVVGDQAAFNERREVILESLQVLCEAIGKELAKPCAPLDWEGIETGRDPHE